MLDTDSRHATRCSPSLRVKQPVGFFIHHHGSGHIKRCRAIVKHITDRPVVIFCADIDAFTDMADNVTLVGIPNPHGKPSRTRALHEQPSASVLDCAPLGVTEIRTGMGQMAQWMATADPALFVSDVSAEVALLARLMSVPAVKLRMHGDRSDLAHQGAYSGCVGLVAPFDERLEQTDWPAAFQAKTFYTGGLIDSSSVPPSRLRARQRLALDTDQQVIVSITGSGCGIGAPLAPLTVAARALPEARWLVLGRTVRYGHETDFANLQEVGWVDNAQDYIAAADVVVATPGDTLVHEVARIGRPLICVPEWCYYGEQAHKAQALERLNAAVYSPTWPASFAAWRTLVDRALHVDLAVQRSLVNEQAAHRAARFLCVTADALWREEFAAGGLAAVTIMPNGRAEATPLAAKQPRNLTSQDAL